MTFTAITSTDLAQQAARLRAMSNRISRGDFRSQPERRRAIEISSALAHAGQLTEQARELLPESGLDFFTREDQQ